MNKWALLILFICYPLFVTGQSKKELEKDKLSNLEKIEYANKILNETKTKKSKTLRELSVIDRRIELRKDLIRKIQIEINELDRMIYENEEIINSLKNDLQKKKNEYKELIILAFKKRSRYNDLMYILGSKTINEGFKRLKYLQSVADYRKKQTKIITEVKEVLEHKNLELEIKKESKQILLVQKREETAILDNEIDNKKDIINELRKKEKELKEELAKRNRIKKELEEKINAIIELERKRAVSGNMYERLTPAERLISNDFVKNKGRLPWPTEKGIITEKYGEHWHAVLRGVKVRNNGVDITTTKNAEVRCIFDGEVSMMVAIPGGNYAVIVKHGNYFTVYQNLVRVSVKKGDKVKTKQKLGIAFTEDNEETGVIQFQVWKENEKLNPEDWISNY